ncbi:MAG TPA: DegT/DnrJ/EryC1/StrS aminotransferase family protein [Sphingomicrobium sp.]|nr:DegT/DnrJ/EryC1/StrS aminotransferase family protein [Sphingomicrobium sp.]
MNAPWPSFTDEEKDAVAGVIGSNRVNYWTGDEGRQFESEFADWAGSNHAIALANGTLALELALKALEIGPGDEVIVTPRTFIASVSCVVNQGATPVFADVDPDSGNITPESARAVLTGKTRAIVPVHLAGWPCDMPGFQSLAQEAEVVVVEDCAQAHGATIDGRNVGSFGAVGAWSFCQDKILTTGGEGGMVTTDDPDLWSKMWSFKDHGKAFDRVFSDDHPPGFRWLHESFGSNYRMLEVQAVIGRIQLRRLADWHERRTANARAIAGALLDFPASVRAPIPTAGFEHAFYRLYAYVRPEGLANGWDRDRNIAELATRDVPAFEGSCSEVYLEKAFDDTPFGPAEPLPIARELGETSLAFLTHPTLTPDAIEHTGAAIREVFALAAR